MDRMRTDKARHRRKGRAGRLWHKVAVPILLGGAVLVIILGLVLPSVLMTRQKRRLTAVSIRTELGADVSVAQTASFEGIAPDPLRLARLINAQYETGNVAVHEPLEGEMTETVAIAQAVKEVSRMAELGLIPAYCAALEGAQYTALLGTWHYNMSAEREYDPAYDFWDISFYTTDLTVHLQMDVLSGRILSLEATVYNNTLQRIWAIENDTIYVTYGESIEVTGEYDEASDLLPAEREAWNARGVVLDRIEMTATLDDGTVVDPDVLPEGIGSDNVTEVTLTLIDDSGEELERISLKEELSLIRFSDGFEREPALKTYIEQYLGFITDTSVKVLEYETYADIDHLYFFLGDYFIEASLSGGWEEAIWYISYDLN